MDSSSSSEGESSEDEAVFERDEDEIEDQFDKWGELDHDAEESADISRRLAVCNMDWDRVGAEDIFLALASFCPKSSSVKKVEVYLSDFGRERLADEDRLGPQELRSGQNDAAEQDDSDDEDDEEVKNKKAMEKVRKYQINRLKYYYAVAEFDSARTADEVYKTCDGAEYELSATRFDLRFIPDEMTFDEGMKKAACEKMPDPDKYKPKVFATTALQQRKVDLTWDENDPEREKALKRAFEDDNEDIFKAFLASSSDDEEDGGPDGECGQGDDDVDAIAKYKALFADLKAKDEKKEEEENDGGMEVVFTDEKVVKENLEKKAAEELGPWEQYLHKKKIKKKEKRLNKMKQKVEEAEDDDDTDDEDEEVPNDVDFNDPFFAEENVNEKNKKKTNKKKKKKPDNENEEENHELELLTMDSDDERQHFDYKEIVKNESSKNKKKMKKIKKKQQDEQQDNFQLDLSDSRFGSIFSRPEFNVDPSHPSFKKTKSMNKIIEEKQKRILKDDEQGQEVNVSREENTDFKRKSSAPIDSLLKSVQAKTNKKRRKK